MAKKIDIAGELNAATTEGIIADSAQIRYAEGNKTIEQKVKELDTALDDVQQDIDNLNSNTGIDEYTAFSETRAYSAGDIVNYQGKLYQFTADHAAGAWAGSDAEKWSLREELVSNYNIGIFLFENITVEDNAESNTFANGNKNLRLYSDKFKITIKSSNIKTTGNVLRLVIYDRGNNPIYRLINDFSIGNEYTFNIKNAYSCMLYINKGELTQGGSLKAEVYSGFVYNDIAEVKENVSEFDNQLAEVKENVSEFDNQLAEVKENVYIKRNFLEIDPDRLYFNAKYNSHNGEVYCEYDAIQIAVYLKFTGANSKYINVVLLDSNVKITNISITYYDESNVSHEIGVGSNPYIDLSKYYKIRYVTAVFNTVDGVTKFSELGVQPFAKILCENEDILISKTFDVDDKIVIDKGKYYNPQLISKSVNGNFGNSFINIFNKKSYYISSNTYSECYFKVPNHNIGEKISIYVYIDSSQLNIDNETYGNIQTLSVRFQDESNTIQTVNLDGSYQLRNGWNCITSSVLNVQCTRLKVEVYAYNNLTYNVIIGAINVGRKVKPVLTISNDGIYSSSYESGYYNLLKENNIPLTLIAAVDYNQNNDYTNFCKELQTIGLVEFGLYSGTVRTQETFVNAYNEIYTNMQDYLNNNSKELIVMGCQHNKLAKYVETAGIANGFKVFRDYIDKNTNILTNVEGLRAISTKYYLISEGYDGEKQNIHIQAAKDYIDKLIANQEWGDLMTHQVVNFSEIKDDDYNLGSTYEFWEEIIRYIKDKVDKHQLIVTTIGQLYRNISNEI